MEQGNAGGQRLHDDLRDVLSCRRPNMVDLAPFRKRGGVFSRRRNRAV